jgi:hypothetical protein
MYKISVLNMDACIPGIFFIARGCGICPLILVKFAWYFLKKGNEKKPDAKNICVIHDSFYVTYRVFLK